MKKYILIILSCFFLSSCLGTKKLTEKISNTKSVEKVETTSDSTSKETVNKAIKDAITVEVPVSDPKVDAKIDEILSKLNTTKSSGSNNYKLYYDEKLRQIRAEFEVGETRDKEVETSMEANTEKTFEQNISENTKKVIKMMPWWAWILIIWVTRKIFLIPLISIFVPGITGINTIQDLFNPPNKQKDD